MANSCVSKKHLVSSSEGKCANTFQRSVTMLTVYISIIVNCIKAAT